VIRPFLGFGVILLICAAGPPGFAQVAPSLAQDGTSSAGLDQAHGKKGVHKPSVSSRTGHPTSEEAEKAARLEEGRKKFFQQSMGFDHGGSDNPVTLSGGNGLSPALGLKF
jgi:hypothetical protein